MIVKYSVERLKAMPRPKRYLREMKSCALRVEGKGDAAVLTFDTNSPRFKALREKYRNAPKERTQADDVGPALQAADADAAAATAAVAVLAPPKTDCGKSLRKRPALTFSNLVSVCSALMFGKGVSLERREKRLKICRSCEKMILTNGIPRCGVCGCKVHGSSALVDLLRFEETPKYGCKHPRGSRWKAADV